MYRIMARRQGGILGNKSAWLKENGIIYETHSLSKAMRKANLLMKYMNKRMDDLTSEFKALRNTQPRFQYTVVEHNKRSFDNGRRI